MNNVEIMIIEREDGTTFEKVTIDRGNGEYTSMSKSVYDEQQAAQAEHLNGSVDGKASAE